MQPLRIVLTCEDYFPHVGGAEVCVNNLKKQLEQRGHAVTLFTNTLSSEDAEKNVVRVPWKFSIAGLTKNIRALWRVIGTCDIVHSQYCWRLALLSAAIAKLRGKPMVLTQQGKGIVREQNPTMLNAFFAWFCRKVSLKLATSVTATSDEILQLSEAAVRRGDTVMISNGYDSNRFRPDAATAVPAEYAAMQGRKFLLSVRRLVPKNGIHIAVQALALVKEKHDDFHYFAIGEGRVQPFIEQLISELGLENHVTLLGKKPNDEILPYERHADLFLIPSSAEARSIACIEAMGMGLPVIASKVGGLIELLGRDNTYGTLVNIYDNEACTYDPPERLPRERLQPLADAIVAFLENPEPFKEKAKKAAEYARTTMSWGAVTEQYEQMYRRVTLSVVEG